MIDTIESLRAELARLRDDREARGIDTNRLLCALASARERRED